MEINLSAEMIEKVTCTAWGRVRELKRKINEAETMETTNYREEAKKNILLKDLNKALVDAEEVHQLFISMLNEIEGQ